MYSHINVYYNIDIYDYNIILLCHNIYVYYINYILSRIFTRAIHRPDLNNCILPPYTSNCGYVQQVV